LEVVVTTGLAASLIIAIAVGVRLLWLARKTRQAPETMWGLAWVLFAFHAGSEILILLVEQRELALTLFVFFGVLTGSALVLTNWLVFRRHSRIAQVIAWAFVVALGGSFLYQLLGPGFVLTAVDLKHRGAANLNPLPLWLVRHTASVALAWGAVESLRHRHKQLKQLTLGLGSALAARRFGLWALSCTSFLLLVGATYLAAYGVTSAVVEYIVQPIASLSGAVCMWLAFFPPRAWRQRLAAKEVA
jgi:hypothetical protein